nr:MAG TPA: hypothetical protein [Caudoviricetes sp.]
MVTFVDLNTTLWCHIIISTTYRCACFLGLYFYCIR